ncbi:MAG: serine/threonine protein kinase, partial [Gemmataceae bacterium]
MAPKTKTNPFIDRVLSSGLVTAEQLSTSIQKSLPEDPVRCATILVEADLLTSYQAKQLLAGKSKGFIISPYKILRPIGQGGMGIVFLGEHISLKRKVAIKVLSPERAKDQLALDRFLREARAAAALDHQNIVKLFDISQGTSPHFLVLEYVDGTDLQSLVAKTGPLHFAQAAHYISQAASGLHHAHTKGFIHREIKPANLIMAKDGTLKILDMGLAQSLLDPSDQLTAVNAEGEITGTIDYLSPEQAMAHPLDERSDIYSLGATLYSLLTGQPPFSGSTTQKLMQHQLKEPTSVAIKLRGRVPQPFSDVISKMMAKKLADRYQSAEEVIEALSPWVPATGTNTLIPDP